MRALILLALLLAPALSCAATPSFNCARAHARVEQMICTTPSLAAADRKLAADYAATAAQAGIDPHALRRAEDTWLVNTRDKCTAAACIAAAYAARDAAILDESQQAASPAAYAQTRPYPAPAPVLAALQSAIGGSCAAAGFGGAPSAFSPIPGFTPITANGYYLWPAQTKGTRVLFLLLGPASACHVADAAVLPAASTAAEFLQCAPDAGTTLGGAGVTIGAGLRHGAKILAFWDAQTLPGQLTREPLGVLGMDQTGLRCEQPETGE